MYQRKSNVGNIIKGTLIGVLCLVLIVGVVLCVRGPKNPGEAGQDVELSVVPTAPAETQPVSAEPAPTGAPQLQTEPTKPEPVPTQPQPTEPETRPQQPSGSNPGTSKPNPPKPTEPAPTEPEKDIVQILGQVSAENNVVTEDTSFGKDNVSAQIPSGTLLEEGTSKLVLTIEKKESSDSGITTEAGQSLQPLDVHIEGISKENTAPITISLGKILPNGMNIGNLGLYHVENGSANPMVQVLTPAELNSHNQFYYDPATGDITVAMASFSEIAVVSAPAKWEGKYDYTWYDANAKELTIANADQLAAFAQIVGGMAEGIAQDSFAGKTVKLLADIDLADDENNNVADKIFYPIGYYYTNDKNADGTTGDLYSTVYSFEGAFDGQGHTIANFYQNTWEIKGDYDNNYYSDAMGLFGYVVGGKIENLTVDHFSSDGEFTPTGVIAAYAVNSEFKNIAITNCNPRVYNTGNGGIVGIGGNTDDPDAYKLTFTNITIDNTNKITALWGSWDVACGGLVGMFRGAGHVYMTNCHVAAQIDVFNDVCGNYQYYWYRYSGMLVGTNKNMITDPETGRVYPETGKYHAENCTVHFGTWNDYYYCELVANSLASYTHDHQFSRLDLIDSLDEIKSGETWLKTGNFLLIDGDTKTCYHIIKSGETLVQHTHESAGTEVVNGETVLKENNQIIYLPFNQLFTGYGWGVNHIPVYNGEDYAFNGVTILDRQFGTDSVQKFGVVGNIVTVAPGESVEVGALFNAISQYAEDIDKDNVQVFVSAVGEDSTASGTYTANTEDWTKGTVTFNGLGTAEVTIQDYYFCTPTKIILTVAKPASVDKFQGNDQTFSKATVTLGEIFTYDDTCGVEVDNANVTVTVTKDGTDVTDFTPDTTDWTKGTVTFDGTIGDFIVTITDNNLCNPASVTVTLEKATRFVDALTDPEADFLYRVGNKDSVALSSLFEAAAGQEENVGTVEVTVTNERGNATGTYTPNATWSNGTIQFSGTGVVTVTIFDNNYSNPLSLRLEVVDAYNRTTASFSGNSVLLNDVSTSSTLSTSGVIYGNGFTVNMENAPINEKNGAVFHLYDGAILKNLNIVGKEFTTVAMTVNDTNYGVSAVRAWGTVVIENCYISGCRSAVSVTGSELTIKDSVIANGVYANVDFRSGILNLHNVTTINEPHSVNGSTIVGLGIVGNMTASAGRQLNITGTLTQYNWVSKADCNNIKADGISTILNSVFTDSKYAAFRYTYNGTTYVNTGIMSLCSDFLEAGVPATPANYVGKDVDASLGGVSGSGYVWAPGQAGTLTTEDMKYHGIASTPVANDQGTSYIPPEFVFTETDLEVEAGVVQINYENGSSYTLTNADLKKIFTAKKYGQALPYTIFMNDVEYTNKDIVFDATASQNYTITYTVTDNLVYDKDGNLTSKTYQVEKELKVFATVVDKGADAPTFTFYYGTNGSASAGTPHTTQPTNTYTSTIKQVGETYYIMPNVNATSANAIGSKTIDGTAVYYPIVDGINVRSGSSTDYDYTRYYPLFKAVTISDNGTEYSYSGTKEIPATVTWVSFEDDGGNGASSLNDGFGLYNNQYLCKIQKKAGDAEAGGTAVAKFSYTALDGNTYFYYVGFRFYDESEGCITGDTLITLADGSQVRVDALTGNEELLVWNLETGSYDTAPIVFVDTDSEAEYEVVNLHFSDGSEVGVIYEHGFFDYDLGKYVYLDASNATDYIGHTFVTQGDIAGNTWNTATLTDVVIEKKVATAYSPVTFSHLCYYTDGVLSMPGGIEGLFNIFDVDTDLMAYDADKKAQDIETYGLYTYEDFAGIIPEEAYYAFNGAYLKVAIEKGLLTWEDIEYMAERYIPLM